MPEEHEIRLNISMLVMTMIWGMTFVAIKTLLTEISPGNIVLFRFFAAGGLLLFAFIFLNGKLPFKDFLYLCLLGGIGVTLYQLLWTYALKYTSVVNVSIILYSAPLFTTLFSTLFGRESLKIDRLLAVLAGFAGIWIVIIYGGRAAHENNIRGDLLATSGAMIWSLYIFLSKPLLARHSPLKVAAYTIVTGSILFCPLVPLLLSVDEFVGLSFTGWIVLSFTVLFSIIITFFVWYHGMDRVGPLRAVAYQHLVPVFSALFALVLLKEKLCIPQVAGGLIVCGSIAMARKL